MPTPNPTKPAESETRRRVRQMVSAGVKPRDIAVAIGISTQAVWRHRKAIEAEDRKSA